MTAQEIVQELEALGSEATKKVLLKHGAREPLFGVKVEELKKIQKRIRKNQALALELYATGISDAMYLAGLIADDAQMTRADLQQWAEQATWQMISESTVAWVAAESRYGRTLALEWIESPCESVASSGWATLSSLVSITDDSHLDIAELKQLLERVGKTIHQQPNRVRSTMNGFLIAVGSYVAALTDFALETAKTVGPVSVDKGDTSCKVPEAASYIRKLQDRGAVGKKRKTARC